MTHPQLGDIILYGCELTNTDIHTFFSESREKEPVMARRMLGSFLIEEGYSMRSIAITLSKDRTTIRNYYEKHKGFMKYDPEYQENYEKFKKHSAKILGSDD